VGSSHAAPTSSELRYKSPPIMRIPPLQGPTYRLAAIGPLGGWGLGGLGGLGGRGGGGGARRLARGRTPVALDLDEEDVPHRDGRACGGSPLLVSECLRTSLGLGGKSRVSKLLKEWGTTIRLVMWPGLMSWKGVLEAPTYVQRPLGCI
jgi:hypothetical protein